MKKKKKQMKIKNFKKFILKSNNKMDLTLLIEKLISEGEGINFENNKFDDNQIPNKVGQSFTLMEEENKYVTILIRFRQKIITSK